MLKYKVIRAFVAVWCVVCVSYGGVRAALGALLGGQGATSEVTESVQEVEVRQEPPAADDVQLTTESGSQETEANEEDVTEEDMTESEAETSDVPSLSEYLSGFVCGSCRRNCTLDNPRCHNGSRLAEAKAQEYLQYYQ
ncbi:MAG: hypothetical protein Q4A01_03815 [Coriobacteriales bacterium]|nr:hypothetical protein [Coriobacteriales bacterium]